MLAMSGNRAVSSLQNRKVLEVAFGTLLSAQLSVIHLSVLGSYPPPPVRAMWGQGGDLTPCKGNNPTTGA